MASKPASTFLWCFDGDRCEVCGNRLSYAWEVGLGCCSQCADTALRHYPSDTRIVDLEPGMTIEDP
jgi:hypothetical protein